MATAEATQRIYKHAESGGSEAATLLGTPVGQVVGMMNARRPSKNIVADWVNEYVETVSGLAHQLEEAASEG
jgi:hypothetical protein